MPGIPRSHILAIGYSICFIALLLFSNDLTSVIATAAVYN
jgi:hypothetical protein